MKKKVVIAVCVLSCFAALWTTGCTKKVKVVELEILLSDDTLEGGAMAHVVQKFNEEFKDKGIQAKVNEIAYADVKPQLLNRAAVGELPALIKFTNFDEYIDYVLPLNDTTLNQEDFLRNGTRKGMLYGTSINNTAVGLIINKTAFDKADVKYPVKEEDRWTWAQFEVAVKQVVAKNTDVTTGLVVDFSQQRINTILYQFGMQYFDPQNQDKILFRSDKTKNGLDFILNMYKTGGISKASVGVGTENAQSAFKTGTVAAHLSGNWVINDYRNNIKNFEWCPVLMPYEEERATSLGGNWFFAMKDTGVEKEAKLFLEWFYEPENYELYCATGNYLPGKRGITPQYEIEGLDIFNQEMNVSSSQPNFDTYVGEVVHSGESWGNATREAVSRAIAGEMDSAGVMNYVVDIIRKNYTNVSE